MVKTIGVAERDRLRGIKSFPSLVKYLRDELEWPIVSDDFEELTFEYEPEELGIDAKNAAKIDKIMQLRPLVSNQPWGIFFVKFEPKRLPVVALRRILRELVMKKRASANRAGQATWKLHDLLFISNYGEGYERQITFAHFSENSHKGDLPTLKVLGWDEGDAALHLDHVYGELHEKLTWPEDESDQQAWRTQWGSAFTLRHREVIATSKQLALRLAGLAHDIRARVNAALAVETEKGPLRTLMAAFKESLIHDLSDDDFADMYAQTIAYGLLSARISRPAGLVADNIADMVPVTNPFLKELMETFLHLGGRKKAGKKSTGIDFDELGINDVVDLLREANMEAVLRDFDNKNPEEDPVIHFYELFLHEYDKNKKMQRGVFYTPKPVVSFIVRSVDEILRTEFGLEDGLADITTWGEMVARNKDLEIPEGASPDQPFVQILDPATGTGTFLVEVIDVIHRTMTKKWKEGGHGEKKIGVLWNNYVPEYLLPRIHGYELMMAPYAIAHMKIGLKLYETGYRFVSEERARVYLTNALEPTQELPKQKDWVTTVPALAHEANAVNAIKLNQRFTAVIGNPPYSVKSANMGDWIRDLLASYKKGLNERKLNLDDDYIKFIRYAEYHIGASGVGILAYISNNSFLDGVTHRQMRRSLLNSFNDIYILNLHGSITRKEVTPQGGKDENVFDIQTGVGISILTNSLPTAAPVNTQLYYHDLFGLRGDKYDYLLNSACSSTKWLELIAVEQYYFFIPKDFSLDSEYCTFVYLPDLFPLNSNGIETHKDELMIQEDASSMRRIMDDLVNLSESDFKSAYKITKEGSEWRVASAQKDARRGAAKIIGIEYRPFDKRFTTFTSKSKGLLARPRHNVMRHFIEKSNIALCLKRQAKFDFSYAFVANKPSEACLFESAFAKVNLFPLIIFPKANPQLCMESQGIRPNLDEKMVLQLSNDIDLIYQFDAEDPLKHGKGKRLTPIDILNYCYSVLHSPNYRRAYKEFLKIDFPRVPLPCNLAIFQDLACLGAGLVSLHLFESSVLNKYITSLIDPNNSLVEKVSYSDETVWIDKAKTRGFCGVPEEVWGFHLGGYQVCEKWLKDRQAKGGKNPRPGRVLTDEDIDHYQKIIVAINETIRIMNEIDDVIDQHGGWPDAFSQKDA